MLVPTFFSAGSPDNANTSHTECGLRPMHSLGDLSTKFTQIGIIIRFVIHFENKCEWETSGEGGLVLFLQFNFLYLRVGALCRCWTRCRYWC